MYLRITTVFLLVLGILTGAVWAGVTGKISGRIVDAQSGEALPGVNISLENTGLGAATDSDGLFIILNVPPGLYTAVIDFIGYQTVRVRNLRVNVDFTTRVDQRLTSSAIAIGEVEVFGERNPLVRQDLTNTQVAVTREVIESLPVDQLSDIIALQAGIVEDNSGALHIRGGRSNEIAFQVNGLGINNPFGNTQGVGLATNAVEEVSVSAGTFSAEYGNALSGVINFVTKDGGPDFHASLRAYTGDNVSSRDALFFNIDEVDPMNNARAEWTLSGPIPIMGNKLTFFTSGVYQKDNGHLYGIRVWNPEDMLNIGSATLQSDPEGFSFTTAPDGTVSVTRNDALSGADGDREIVPMVTRESINLTGKLTWKARHNFKLSYDVIFDDGERFSSGDFRSYRFTPDGRPKTLTTNVSHSLGLTHTLSKSTFYTLKLGVNQNDAFTAVYEDANDPRYVPVTFVDENDNEQFSNDISRLVVTRTGYIAGGQDFDRVTENSRTLLGKIDLVSQVHPSHELKMGGEFAMHTLELDSYGLQFDLENNRFFKPSDDKFINFNAYERKPIQGALYFLDKMELDKRFILNVGLRYEYLDTEAPYNPDLAGTVDDIIGVSNPAFLRDSEVKHRLSPRVSFSFPITATGIIRFSYGFFYQNPTFRNIYRNPRFQDNDFQSAPSFGNPNLNPQRSTQYEMGLQQQFTDDIKMDLTVFYKDVTDLIQDRRVIAGEVGISKEFNVVTNISYANVRGFTAAFLKRRSPTGLFSATLDYTFQVAEGAFTDPLALAVDTRTGRQSAQQYIPLSFDRTHTLNGTITLSKPGNWSASAITRLQSGTPYTPSVVSSIQAVDFESNSDRRPWILDTDMKIEKFFRLQGARFSIFAQVENLFDSIQERFIHTNTGSSLSNLNETLNPSEFSEARRAIERNPQDFFPMEFIDNYYQREDWLGEPREVRLGMSFQF